MVGVTRKGNADVRTVGDGLAVLVVGEVGVEVKDGVATGVGVVVAKAVAWEKPRPRIVAHQISPIRRLRKPGPDPASCCCVRRELGNLGVRCGLFPIWTSRRLTAFLGQAAVYHRRWLRHNDQFPGVFHDFLHCSTRRYLRA